jgi:hypothetical protein
MQYTLLYSFRYSGSVESVIAALAFVTPAALGCSELAARYGVERMTAYLIAQVAEKAKSTGLK